MKTKEVLIAARKKIERPECWTKGASARNRNSRSISALSDNAVCWCATGAIYAVGIADDICDDAVDALESELAGHEELVPEFNDRANTTHADVLALFDRAIAACKEE